MPRFRRKHIASALSEGWILHMNDLIIPPEPPQPNGDSSAKWPIEIVIDRQGRRSRRLRYGLTAAFLGLAAVVATRAYGPYNFKETTTPQTEAQAARQASLTAVDEATQRRIIALQSEVRELRAKLDAVEKRQQAENVSAQASSLDSKAAMSAAEAAPVTHQPPEKVEPTIARATKNESAKVDMTPVKTVAPASKVVKGYRLRDVYHGAALVESNSGMIGVKAGEVLPGVGRVIAIQERAGRWVVVTENGEIIGEARGQARAQAPRKRHFNRELYGFMPEPFAPPIFVPY